jgi:FdhD protein
MRTPGNDDELALGFLYTEGIGMSVSQIEATDQVNANVVKVAVNPELTLDLSRLERHFYTTSSCGICGKASLEALSMEGADAIHNNTFSISRSSLSRLAGELRNHQPMFRETGGNHGVALFDAEGNISQVREDVGRHNAMDKLVGFCMKQNWLPLQQKGILVSGRASFELMQKALMAGCPMLVAVGAPSSLAVELAEEFNMSLLGFLSAEGYNLYHGNSPV